MEEEEQEEEEQEEEEEEEEEEETICSRRPTWMIDIAHHAMVEVAQLYL